MATVVPNWNRVMASVRVHPEGQIRQGIRDVLSTEPALQPLLLTAVSEVVFLALKDGLREVTADKAYFLKKLQEQNKAAEAIAEYLAALAEQSRKLAEAEKGKGKNDDPYECTSAQPESWLDGLPIRFIPVSASTKPRPA